MKPRKFFILLALTGLLSSGRSDESLRDWTNKEGKTISASLAGVENETVTLRLENGRRYEVPLASLSELDREFCKEWLAAAANASKSDEMGLKHSVPVELIVSSPFSVETPPTRKGDVGRLDGRDRRVADRGGRPRRG